MSGIYELQILKQVRLLKGPVKTNFSHVVSFVVVDQELLLRCPVMAVLKDKLTMKIKRHQIMPCIVIVSEIARCFLSGPGQIIVYAYHSVTD